MQEPVQDNDNGWTVAGTPFRSGVVATSGSIVDIMKGELSAKENDARAKMNIYANVYVDLGNGPLVMDRDNAGLTVDDMGFNGAALSLYEVMCVLDNIYSSFNTTVCLQLDDFYTQWANKGMDWDFENIGKATDAVGAVETKPARSARK